MISAYIGECLASKELLEFVASSSHCQEVVVGQTLHKKHRQVSVHQRFTPSINCSQSIIIV